MTFHDNKRLARREAALRAALDRERSENARLRAVLREYKAADLRARARPGPELTAGTSEGPRRRLGSRAP